MDGLDVQTEMFWKVAGGRGSHRGAGHGPGPSGLKTRRHVLLQTDATYDLPQRLSSASLTLATSTAGTNGFGRNEMRSLTELELMIDASGNPET